MSNQTTCQFQQNTTTKIKCQFEERWGQKLADCTGYYIGNPTNNRINLCPACRNENILRTNRRRNDLVGFETRYDEKGIEYLVRNCYYCDHEFKVNSGSARYCLSCRSILGKHAKLSRLIGYCECGNIFPAIGNRKFCSECIKKTPYVKYGKPQLKHRKAEKKRSLEALSLLNDSNPKLVIVPPQTLQHSTPEKFVMLSNKILNSSGYKLGAVR